MDNIAENNEVQFANGQKNRDLLVSSHAVGPDGGIDGDDLREPTVTGDGLGALRQNPGEDLDRRVELRDRNGAKFGTSGGSSWYRRINKRLLLLVLLVLALAAVSPFVWNYLQSYESTDDAQIDGHIDPLSSRINGTVIRVRPE